MKIFFYALREYDEQKYVEEFAKKYPFEYGFTSFCQFNLHFPLCLCHNL